MAETSRGERSVVDGPATGGSGGSIGGGSGSGVAAPATPAAPPAPAATAGTAAGEAAGGRGDSVRLSQTRSGGGGEMELSSSPSVRDSGVESFLRSDTARIVPQALDPSAYPDNVEMEILERLSKSQVGIYIICKICYVTSYNGCISCVYVTAGAALKNMYL